MEPETPTIIISWAFLIMRYFSDSLWAILSIQAIDRGTANAIMLRNLRLAAAGRFEVLDQVGNLLLCQFRPGAKLHTASHGLESPFQRSILDQFPLEFANCGKDIKLQPTIHGRGVNALVQDHQINVFAFELLNDSRQIDH